MNDTELLRAWAARRDEAAFAELVRRHLALVYASAKRQVGGSPLADDVAQAVFLVLARKAGSLGGKVVLSGWLFRTTRFVAARALRAEKRRLHHESASAMQLDTAEASVMPEHWEKVRPHLDAALAALPGTDRDAVLLRFFEGEPLRAVGERLGVNEQAAKKRVSRAVEKLRAFLAGKGVVLTVAGLLTLLANLPGIAAPAGLAGEISAAVGADAMGPAATTLAAGASRDWFVARMMEVAPWFAVALVMLLAGGVWWDKLAAPEAAPVVETVIPSGSVRASAPVPVVSSAAIPAAQIGPSKILVSVRAAEDNRPLVARGLVLFWARRSILRQREIVTDINGAVEIPATEPNLDSVRLWLSAPGYVPVGLRWERHEFVEPILLYTCRLQRGRTLQGTVQDEAGRPVSDAKVQFGGPSWNRSERESIAFLEQLTSVVSDATGHFQSNQMPDLLGDRTMSYTVSHPDFVRERRELAGPATLATNHLVVLRRGLFARGRVIGPDGVPVAGAEVTEDPDHLYTRRETKTAADGRFVIGPFAADAIPLEVSAAGFVTATQSVATGEATPEAAIRLERDADANDLEQIVSANAKTVRMVGTVVDADSGFAIPQFLVSMTEHRGVQLDLLGEGQGGRFDWPVEMWSARQFSLQVDAEGYDPVDSELRPVQEGTEEFTFRLHRGGAVRGVVVGPDGRAVAGASVGLNGPTFGVIVTLDGRMSSGNGAPQAVTDSEGRFSLQPRLGAQTLLAVHDRGCVLLPIDQISRTPVILQPWGAIEGVLLVGGQPAPGQSVILWQSPADDDSQAPGINVQGTAATDANGRFRFDRMPTGPVDVSRLFSFHRGASGPMGLSSTKRVEVPAGVVAEVTIGIPGRAVVGRLVLGGPVVGHDWRDDLQSLVQVRDDLPPVKPPTGMPGSPEFMKAIHANDRREAQIAKHYLVVQPDGSFRIDDVQPGRYLLNLSVTEPKDPTATVDYSWDRAELGTAKQPVVIPENPDPASAPPLDLGTITIPVKRP